MLNRIAKFTDANGDDLWSPGESGTQYSWDHRNRLTTVAFKNNTGQVSTTVEYEYDPFNQMIKRELDSDGELGSAAIQQAFFLYELGQIVLQFDKSGPGDVATDNLSHRYLWGAAVDELLADEQVDWGDEDADGEVLWALADHLGSVRDVVDSNGTLRIHRQFDSFGNIVAETHYDAAGASVSASAPGHVSEAFAYTGKFLDTASGLQNNLFRWYDPAVGRWISEDPIAFAAGDANLSRYVGNEATAWVDPTGLASGISDEGLFPPEGLNFNPRLRLNWILIATDDAGTEIFLDPDTGMLYGIGGSGGWGKPGRINEDGDFVPDGALEIGDEPPTLELALDAGLGAAGKLAKGAIGLAAVRRTAVRQAWKQEQQLVRRYGYGTRDWAREEVRQLLETGKVRGYQGHHINSVNAYPELVRNPNNVEWVTRSEHLERHGGNWRNPTFGQLIDRWVP